jgi:cullin-associated NEDD8-dissociated protein 1
MNACVPLTLHCTWLDAGLGHFDLSFWAFEQLAHPLYGIQMLEYRAVDCDSGAPVANSYISKTDIYQGGTKAGWNWFPYGDSYSRYAVPGEAVNRCCS